MILDLSTARRLAAAVEPARPSLWQRIGRALIGSLGSSRLSAAEPYKAAAQSRSKDDWIRTSAGPNTTVAASRKVLVARSRDMVRNDPHGARIINVWVNNTCGTGLMARALHDGSEEGKARAAKADAIWAAVNEKGVLDVTGQLTGAGQQRLEARACATDGEVYIRRVIDRTAPVVPIRTEVLECDMLDESMSLSVTEGGNRIVQGVELNARNRRVAYWFLPSHPGEAWGGGGKSVRVPAEDVICLALPGRPGQVRSTPLMSSVMVTKKDLADFENFTIIQKKTEALTVGVVNRGAFSEWNPPPEPPAADPVTGDVDVLVPNVIDSDGNITGTMRPGGFFGLENGESITFHTPQLAANYDVFKKTHLQSVAVGVGMSYEQVSGDFSNANYSTMRGGLLEFWVGIDAHQWCDFVPAQDRKWQLVMEAAWLVGLLDTFEVKAEWQTPQRQSIEPDKDVIAHIMQVRAGFVDEDDVIAGYGYHPETLRKKQAENMKRRDELGLINDTDPRKYAWRGAFPPAAAGTPIADEVPPTPQDDA